MTRRRFLRQLGALAGSRAAPLGFAAASGWHVKASAEEPLSARPLQAVAAVPRWMQRIVVNQWAAIADTAMATMDCAPQVEAGLTNAQCHDIGFGDPRSGIFAFSGGALKTSGSEMLVFGGGGAGGWAGNDVRGLRLEDDAPVWRTRVKPSSHANVIPRNMPATPYMRDGVTPNARHSYWSPQFIDRQNKFMSFGCANTWNSDTGKFNVVDEVVLETGVWDAPGKHPPFPNARGWDGNWVCKHPVTEDVYVAGASTVSKWSSARDQWSMLWTTQRTDVDRATTAIDPAGGGTLLRIGNYGPPNTPVAIDLATGSATVGSFSGPYADAINIGGYFAAGLVFDRGLGKFVLYQDDGYLYAISRVSSRIWRVDRLPLTGRPPDSAHSAEPGLVAIWGRMQYVPNLRGVCIIQAYDRPAYFVRTS